MIRLKRKNKKKRNPEDFFVNEFVPLLAKNIIKPDLKDISLLLRYKNRDFKCTDCDEFHESCTCEGSTKIRGLPCEECNEKRCICDLIPSRRLVMDIAFSTLPDRYLYSLRKELKNKLKFGKTEKHLGWQNQIPFKGKEKTNIERSIYEIDMFFKVQEND